MNWLQVSDVGNSKIVKSMMIWMLVTPIFAKALSSVNSINISFLETDNNILLNLPFSWQVFFFCALSFTIANLIYSFKCPPLIKKYKYFSDFESNDNSLYLLINYLNDEISENIVRQNFLEIGVIVAKYTPLIDIAKEWTSNDTSNVNWKKGIDSLKHSEVANMPDIFASLRVLLAKFYPNWVKACLFFYGLGFVGIGIVIVQNIIYVLRQVQF